MKETLREMPKKLSGCALQILTAKYIFPHNSSRFKGCSRDMGKIIFLSNDKVRLLSSKHLCLKELNFRHSILEASSCAVFREKIFETSEEGDKVGDSST